MAVTASHRAYSERAMSKTSKVVRSTARAQKRLLTLHAELGSWKAVGERLGRDRGLLRRIALGQQKAPMSVVKVLYPPPSRKAGLLPSQRKAVRLLSVLWSGGEPRG